ncbi:MAG: hypothetical protein V4613_02565 [Bacteroidota bacterium]
MYSTLTLRLFICALVCCICINVVGQKTGSKTPVKSDSSKILKRTIKFKCPDKKAAVTTPTALKYYTFQSMLEADFSIYDSANNMTSNADYTYYFDDSSYFAALKNTYTQGSKRETMVSIEELRDSIEFRTNIKDSNLLLFNNRKNCSGRINRFHDILTKNTKQYKKTGRTKMIMGFLCDEYLLSNDVIESRYWVCSAKDAWLLKIRQNMLYFLPFELIGFYEGIVMESDTYYKTTRHRQVFKVKNIGMKHYVRLKVLNNRLVY